ncbi:hypothetical protein ACI65C_011339 [Semiaphis heraclei]
MRPTGREHSLPERLSDVTVASLSTRAGVAILIKQPSSSLTPFVVNTEVAHEVSNSLHHPYHRGVEDSCGVWFTHTHNTPQQSWINEGAKRDFAPFESNHLKNGSFRFRCTNRTCTESVLVNSTIDKILSFSNNNIHNHEPTTDHNLAVRCVRTALKRKAEEDLHARPNKIIRKEIQDTNPVFMEVIVHNDIKLLRESAYRIRKKHFPKIPTTINEAFDQLFETQVDI